MNDDCYTCGARARHQRMIERRCHCGELFTVKSEANTQRSCSRTCYLSTYRRKVAA